MKDFFSKEWNNVLNFEKFLKVKQEQYWIERGQKQVLKLFHLMSKRVPAYKDFLKKNKLNPEKINTINDFKLIPTIDKNSYLRQYPRRMLCWDGEFKSKSWIISVTSGSTGEPFYFPRQNTQDLQYAILAEIYLRTNFQIQNKSTLYIIGFPMGVWIGGLFTYQALRYVADKGYKLSIITPGINKFEIIKSIKNLGKEFDQIIIGSYGPFLKDIIDDGIRMGLRWEDYNLGFILSAEGFTETFRDYLIEHTGLKNEYLSTLNHYGTVDLGTMSYETPISILARRIAVKEKNIYYSLFGDSIKLPTLTQFLPEMFYFEEVHGSLLCSANSGYPLVRYDLKDHGGVHTFSTVNNKFNEHGVDLIKETIKSKIKNSVWPLPYVYVYERNDFSVSFFAFQIYPETIRKALLKQDFYKDLTGKFTMLVNYNRRGSQYFEINIELKAGVKSTYSLKRRVVKSVMQQLILDNSEYRKTYEEYPKKVVPKIIFWPYEDPKYFKPGTKQKWVKK